MKKIIYLFLPFMALTACSTDGIDSESFDSLDVKAEKATTQDVGDSFSFPELICAGEETTFTFNFNDKPGNISVKLQLEGDDPETVEVEEWYNLFNENFSGSGPVEFNYTFDVADDYNLRYFIGGGGHTDVTVTVENCGCEESFSYVDNGDKTYTFTYIPGEDMTGAKLSFTFPQADAEFSVAGWMQNGNGNAQTWKQTMDLIACTTYEWTVTLTRICMGSTNNNNVWTDFTVNDVSKKGDNQNITQTCPE